jgi:hypothetical protein
LIGSIASIASYDPGFDRIGPITRLDLTAGGYCFV